MDIRARLSLNMRRLRQSKGWSQEEFAHQAGLQRTYVSDLERGARNPTITVTISASYTTPRDSIPALSGTSASTTGFGLHLRHYKIIQRRRY